MLLWGLDGARGKATASDRKSLLAKGSRFSSAGGTRAAGGSQRGAPSEAR